MADIQYENTKESNVSVVGSPTHMISILVKEKWCGQRGYFFGGMIWVDS